jgi:hypothetical protein
LCTRAWSKEQVFQAGLCGCLETTPFVDRHQHGRFAAAAKRHRRSLNNEAIVCLEAGLGHEPLAVEQQLQEIRALRNSLAQHCFDPAEIDASKREVRP